MHIKSKKSAEYTEFEISMIMDLSLKSPAGCLLLMWCLKGNAMTCWYVDPSSLIKQINSWKQFFLNQQSLYLHACCSIDTSYIWVRQYSSISIFSKWSKPWENQTSADINIRLAGKFLWLSFLSMTTEDEISVFSFSQ